MFHSVVDAGELNYALHIDTDCCFVVLPGYAWMLQFSSLYMTAIIHLQLRARGRTWHTGAAIWQVIGMADTTRSKQNEYIQAWIVPLSTGLGPRAFRGPQAWNQANTIALIGLKSCIPPKFFARAYGACNESIMIGFMFAIEPSISIYYQIS